MNDDKKEPLPVPENRNTAEHQTRIALKAAEISDMPERQSVQTVIRNARAAASQSLGKPIAKGPDVSLSNDMDI